MVPQTLQDFSLQSQDRAKVKDSDEGTFKGSEIIEYVSPNRIANVLSTNKKLDMH